MVAWLRSGTRGFVAGGSGGRSVDGRGDGGATLAEVMVVVGMVGTLSAMTVWGIRGWAESSAFKGASQQVQSVLRSTQQQAITEGSSFCVSFDEVTDVYAVYRLSCTDPARVRTAGPFGLGSSKVHLVGAKFLDAGDVSRPGVTFSPRGSAWPGQVRVARDGSPVVVVVRVEGMTGRVSAS